MRISKIKMNDNSGLKGLTINFEREELKDGLTWRNEYPGVKFKYPVQGELMRSLQKLVVHLGNICGLDAAQKGVTKAQNQYDNIIVTGVSAKSDGFVITGSVESNVLKRYTVPTPFVTADDGYEGYDEVDTIIGDIMRLTDDYVNGEMKINKKQYVLDLHAGDENFDQDVFQGLSSEEQEAMFIQTLEDKGHIVLRAPDQEAAA